MLFVAFASEGRPEDVVDQAPIDPAQVLDRAFTHLYGWDLTSEITLRLRNSRGEVSTRRLEVARKEIGGRIHSLGRFVEPKWIRGTSILMVENADRSADHFVFLPEEERIRRVTSVQRSDAFLGTDLWFEDFERRRAEEFEITAAGMVEHKGTDCLRILAQPRSRNGYTEVEFLIESETNLILETRFYRGASDRPFRVIETIRESVQEHAPHLIATRLIVHNHLRDTTTEVHFDELRVNPELRDSLFRAVTLQVGQAIPGL